MNTLEIKGVLHEFITRLHDEEYLQKAYDFLTKLVDEQESLDDHWDTLPDTVKIEIDKAIIESEDPSNLISNEEVFKNLRNRKRIIKPKSP